MTRPQHKYQRWDDAASMADTRRCEHPGCDEAGMYRAPRAPDDLRTYRWFCLDHVRTYNRAWNFFEGWSRPDIERFMRDDVTGHRPTWPVGSRQSLDERMSDLEDVFHAFAREWFGEDRGKSKGNGESENKSRRNGHASLSSEHQEALALLDLEPAFSRDELRSRYKALVKRLHPDANGGNRESEELLKLINRAYTYLRNQIS